MLHLQYAFYQYLLNVADEDCEMLMLRLTMLPEKVIASIMTEHLRAPEKRVAQNALADELTRMVRGDESLRVAKLVRLSPQLASDAVR